MSVSFPKAPQGESTKASSEQPQPIFVSSEMLMGCEVKRAGSQVDTISDALVCSDDGTLHCLLLDSGAVLAFDSLMWDGTTGCFTEQPATSKPVEASGPRAGRKAAPAGGSDVLGQCFQLSKLVTFELVGFEKTDEGRDRIDLGSMGGAFFDVETGSVAFMTTSIGGVLGIGAESRVIPWTALTVAQRSEGGYELRSSLSEERLKEAPAFGEGAESLNNPEYRDRLYSYYGSRRGAFEPSSSQGKRVLPVAQMLGSTIVVPGSEDDELKDLVIGSDDGEVVLALCKSGAVIPVSDLAWDAKERQFTREADSSVGTADVSGKQVLASALSSAELRCGGNSCGDFEGVYFDTKPGAMSYIAIDHDGVKVLPWSVVSIESVADGLVLNLSCSAADLEAAPKLDGDAGASIYSPAFQQRVDAIRPSTK